MDEYVQTRMSLGRIDGKDPYFRTRSHSKARQENCAADQQLSIELCKISKLKKI